MGKDEVIVRIVKIRRDVSIRHIDLIDQIIIVLSTRTVLDVDGADRAVMDGGVDGYRRGNRASSASNIGRANDSSGHVGRTDIPVVDHSAHDAQTIADDAAGRGVDTGTFVGAFGRRDRTCTARLVGVVFRRSLRCCFRGVFNDRLGDAADLAVVDAVGKDRTLNIVDQKARRYGTGRYFRVKADGQDPAGAGVVLGHGQHFAAVGGVVDP